MNKIMKATFGHQWIEDYDPMEEYETSLTHHND